MRHNIKRLSRLLVRGKFKEIFFPGVHDGENNLQRMVKYGNNMLNNVVRRTLNTTINDIADIAKEVPKEVKKRLICFTPNLIRLVREKQAQEDSPNLKRRINNLLGIPGEFYIS